MNVPEFPVPEFPHGDEVSEGADLVTVQAGADQVWEALRALGLIGQPDDLLVVSRYTAQADQVGRQGVETAQAIKNRSQIAERQ